MTHPSEKKDQTDALEKALVDDMTGAESPASADRDDEWNEDTSLCERCGGEGHIEYNDGDGSDWGEDCPSEENHLIACRQCRGTGKAL